MAATVQNSIEPTEASISVATITLTRLMTTPTERSMPPPMSTTVSAVAAMTNGSAEFDSETTVESLNAAGWRRK
jgi:hypothetical protein